MFWSFKAGKSSEQVALEGIRKFEDFIKDMNMPTSLSEYNLPTDDFELIAEKCTKGSCVGRFKSYTKKM